MVFCNGVNTISKKNVNTVTILILIDGFLQYGFIKTKNEDKNVTILILIDGFLQLFDKVK